MLFFVKLEKALDVFKARAGKPPAIFSERNFEPSVAVYAILVLRVPRGSKATDKVRADVRANAAEQLAACRERFGATNCLLLELNDVRDNGRDKSSEDDDGEEDDDDDDDDDESSDRALSDVLAHGAKAVEELRAFFAALREKGILEPFRKQATALSEHVAHKRSKVCRLFFLWDHASFSTRQCFVV